MEESNLLKILSRQLTGTFHNSSVLVFFQGVRSNISIFIYINTLFLLTTPLQK